MEELLESLTGLVAVVCSLGIPVVVIICVYLRKMRRDKQQKEVRQLIIENHTDAETAKLLLDEPKKAKKKNEGGIDLGTLRGACVLLGLGLGALINWVACINSEDIFFWLIIGFGIGVGLLCSFLVEVEMAKKQKPADEPELPAKED